MCQVLHTPAFKEKKRFILVCENHSLIVISLKMLQVNPKLGRTHCISKHLPLANKWFHFLYDGYFSLSGFPSSLSACHLHLFLLFVSLLFISFTLSCCIFSPARKPRFHVSSRPLCFCQWNTNKPLCLPSWIWCNALCLLCHLIICQSL